MTFLLRFALCGLTLSLIVTPTFVSAQQRKPAEPVVLLQTERVGIVAKPDGSYAFFNRFAPHKDVTLKTRGGQVVPLRPRFPFVTPPYNPRQLLLLDRQGELHETFMKLRGTGRKIAVDRFIDIWHRQSISGRKHWTAPRLIWPGYTGSMMEYRQLRSGRIIIPFGKWLPNRQQAPPTGAGVVVVVYSDDGGRTWREGPSQLSSPCYKDYNGSNYGACEPSVVEMKDGRVYMLMRTQAGYLYESWSKDGVRWSSAEPSRFAASSGPPYLLKLPDGRLVMFWNNCAMPPRVKGQGVYGGRDALHAAISTDEGRTWRGFREVYRDPYRNEAPPKTGDRGTAYPFASYDKDGQILLLSGQGRGRRNFIKIDPDWLLQTTKEDDFTNGMNGWHVFKPFGPAKGWWRNRMVGPRLVRHPTRPGASAMHLVYPDGNGPDGATWNFPNGWQGKLTVRLFLKKGFGGCQIGLSDRMFEPNDDNGERLAIFRFTIDGTGHIGAGRRLALETWHTLQFSWNLRTRRCDITRNGVSIGYVRQTEFTGNGISYLRLRSTAKTFDRAGFLVDYVKAEIDNPVAPVRTLAENRALQKRYVWLMRGHRDSKR